METPFLILSTRTEVDLVPYIKQYITTNPETQILIGADSQNRGAVTIFAVVIGLYRPGKGAHVLYRKTITKRGKAFTQENKDFSADTARLLQEVWMSVELAEFLKEKGVKVSSIDVDLNPDPIYKSNTVLSSAVGLVTGMGYKVRHKHGTGEEPHMCYAADSLVKIAIFILINALSLLS